MALREESQWKDVWKLFDADKDNMLTKQEFISALRVLGRRYTAEQMERVTRGIVGNTVDYETYVGVLGDLYDGPTPDDLVNALRAFDGKDCGYFTPQQVQSMLTSMGDKLNDDQLAVVMEGLPVVDGKIDMHALVTYFNPPIPTTKPNTAEIMRDIMREEVMRRELQANEVQSAGSSSAVGEGSHGGAAEADSDGVNSELLEAETFS